MNKFSYFLYTIRRAFAEMCGYDYSLMNSAQAMPYGRDRGEPYPFFNFGYHSSGIGEQEFWGFGKHLLLSRLPV